MSIHAFQRKAIILKHVINIDWYIQLWLLNLTYSERANFSIQTLRKMVATLNIRKRAYILAFTTWLNTFHFPMSVT